MAATLEVCEFRMGPAWRLVADSDAARGRVRDMCLRGFNTATTSAFFAAFCGSLRKLVSVRSLLPWCIEPLLVWELPLTSPTLSQCVTRDGPMS
jgi:hypothetical protein